MTAIKIIVAVVVFAGLLRLGFGTLRVLSRTPPEPPPPGELRRINARYRCSICGIEMKVMLAPDEEPDPPRHCMEEMDVVRIMD